MSGAPAPPPPLEPPPGPPPPSHGPPAPPMPSMMLPPMPPPWDPSYAQWYSQWYYATYGGYQQPPHPAYGGYQPPPTYHQQQPPPAPQPRPPPPPAVDQPPPPGGDDEVAPPAAKKPSLDLGGPPPPPPAQPEWQAAKKGAVIYKTPRPPTPEPPKPEPTVLPPPKLVEHIELATKPEPKKMQWFYDGESWVYALEQPPMKPPIPNEERPEFKYTYGGAENPVGNAVLANLKGKFTKPDKPKAKPVRCDVCNLTVSCQKTYESHIAGKPHRKRAAQTEKIKQLQDKVAADTERAMNSVPGGNKPGNPLQSRPNGDIHCTVCDVTMNSGAQAQSHISGVKHKSKMDRSMRSFRGRGRGFGRGFGPGGPGMMRGGFGFGRGFGPGGPRMWGPPNGGNNEQFEADEGLCDEDEATEEYERVLAEALADNIDVEEAKSRAEAAKQAALGALESFNAPDEHEVDNNAELDDDDDNDEETFPPPGIDIIQMPEGGNPGTYRCHLCGVMLLSESNLSNHLSQMSHQMAADEMKKKRRQQRAASRGQSGRGKSKVYRGRCNAYQEGSMKAQRGRRGLISYGEVMPDKLTKSQKKAQPKDIAELLARKSKQAGGGDDGDIKKVAPLLMSFVKGGIMEGNQ